MDTQNNMMLWFDDELDEDPKKAVARARSYFHGKFGKYPQRVVENFPKYCYHLGPIPKRLTAE